MARTIDPLPSWYMPCGFCKAAVAVHLTKTRRAHYVCNGANSPNGEHCGRHLTMGRRETDACLVLVDQGKLPKDPPGTPKPPKSKESPPDDGGNPAPVDPKRAGGDPAKSGGFALFDD